MQPPSRGSNLAPVRRSWLLSRRAFFPTAGLAIAFPALVTAVMLLVPGHLDTTIAALVYVLAVIAAAAAGGLLAGVGASFLSFLGLNFFFTQPVHTLRVEKVEDVVALCALLIVSTVVATLYSSATEHRQIAERSERETRLLYNAGRNLLAGEPERDVLEEFANALVKMFDLSRCEIRTEGLESPVMVGSLGDHDRTLQSLVPIAVRDRDVGLITLVPASRRPPLSTNEEAVVRAFAGQIALHEVGERLASEARGARMDAETSNLRAALFSSVTHELRTPLASITASVTNLLDPGDGISDSDRVELLETIRDEAHRLNRLVGNLLQLARVRAGAVTPSTQLAAINDVIEGVSARLSKRTGGRRIRLVLREDVPDIWIDLDQIDQVVTNLIENALSYGSEGTEIVVSSARWRDAVEVRVTNQGPGVPEEDRDACSSLSYAARRRGRVVGSASRHRARLRRSSWRLHLDRGSAHRRRVIRLPASERNVSGLDRVLVVDDDPQILRALRTGLRAADRGLRGWGRRDSARPSGRDSDGHPGPGSGAPGHRRHRGHPAPPLVVGGPDRGALGSGWATGQDCCPGCGGRRLPRETVRHAGATRTHAGGGKAGACVDC